MHTKESLNDDARLHNERNDCTVRALTATTGLTYAECHEALRRRGRRSRKGASRPQWEGAANDLGFHFVDVTRSIPGRTIRTAQRYLPRGRRFIIHVRGHVAGFDGEKVLDWAEGRQHRVRAIFEVVPTHKVESPANPFTKVEHHPSMARKTFLNTICVPHNGVVKTLNFLANRSGLSGWKFLTPPPRVRREKWAREYMKTMDVHTLGVIELVGDAAVNHRKKTGQKGRVFMVLGHGRD